MKITLHGFFYQLTFLQDQVLKLFISISPLLDIAGVSTTRLTSNILYLNTQISNLNTQYSIRHHTFSASTFLLQVLVVNRALSSWLLAYAHLADPIAEVDFEVHVLHGVHTSLVDGG
jgi:hypothetical protein